MYHEHDDPPRAVAERSDHRGAASGSSLSVVQLR
jgi:hypothetical protein